MQFENLNILNAVYITYVPDFKKSLIKGLYQLYIYLNEGSGQVYCL